MSRTGRRWSLSRRGFLLALGGAGAGLAFGIHFGVPKMRLALAGFIDGAEPPGALPPDPDLWFELLPDRPIRMYVTKTEMGQGIHTALAQIAADELGLPLAALEVRQAATNEGPFDEFGTAASASVAALYDPLRRAAAAFREMLLRRAARLAGVALDALELHAGGIRIVSEKISSGEISFGDLLADEAPWEAPPAEEIKLRSGTDGRRIGKAVPRVDVPDKVTGRAVYGYDVRRSDMLYGAILRKPTIEARLQKAEVARAEAMPGVVQVVRDGDFVGVVAHTRRQAERARDAIEARWDRGRLWEQAELEEIVTVRGRGGVLIQRGGNIEAGLDAGPSFEAEYRTPFAAHAALEPQGGLARASAQAAEVEASTQLPEFLRNYLDEALDTPKEKIVVRPTYIGGGFGSKAGIAGLEAARLARVVGRPVHVGWNRLEEMRYGFFRPITHSMLRARLEGGRIVAFEHRQASGDVAFLILPWVARKIMGADFGSWRGCLCPYAIRDLSVRVWRHQLPVPTGFWRGLGLFPNVFARESFMDELAHRTGADPLAFRLAHLGRDLFGRRSARVLRAAARRADSRPLPQGRARGLAFCEDANTFVAAVAEVSIKPGGRGLRVHRMTVAVDPGRVVNPDGVRAQVESCVMMGVSSTLFEEVQVRAGVVEATNFDRYPILGMNDAPEVETILLEEPDGKPSGVGEPPIGPIGAAIANALFALTGKRVRSLPLTPERIAAV